MPFLPYFQRQTLSFSALCFPNTVSLYSRCQCSSLSSPEIQASSLSRDLPTSSSLQPRCGCLQMFCQSLFKSITPFHLSRLPSLHTIAQISMFVFFFPALLDEIKGLFLRMASPVFMHIFHITVLQPKARSRHLALLREATQKEKSV